MEIKKLELHEATQSFSSLAQETRLRVLKLLIEYGRDGAVPGAIADELNIPPNTLSFHLSHMSQAGLVTSKKNGRSITYLANCELVECLIEYLRENCCERETRSRSKSKNCNERKC